ncbi:MAG: TetR/AcrR family transcriptional regulator [Eggerthellaceae bacterium]|jgi:AcrR family transcriptional regulator|nr:TetR/AcrR family transcriptional regulator [Eggerthellaceae bacterium]MCH4221620.1 TetR/AcrR family transcriptional regulator [Eggerthellaceae bacterium]
MDLRIVKTHKALYTAFYEIRTSMPLEKVTVTSVCKKALVNKSTFYAHYRDIYALSNEMEDALVDKMMESFPEKDQLFTHPRAFLEGFPKAINTVFSSLLVLFDNRPEILGRKLERQLITIYCTPEQSSKRTLYVTFVVAGMLRIMDKNVYEAAKDKEQLIDTLVAIVEQLSLPQE